MPTFKLTWTIDAEGTDALDAASRVATDYFQARIAQGYPDTACVFQLTDHEGQAVTIDLSAHRIHLECAHAAECERLCAMLAAAPDQPAAQQEQHPDDQAVDRFAVAMKAKLAKSREKGRAGWQTASAAHLSNLLYHHMYKADPLDVANLAMMLHQNGQAIELPHEARHDQGEVQRLREALEFYARGDHLMLADPDAWDTCSGEAENWLHDDEGTASVEDGSLAKAALAASAAQSAPIDTFEGGQWWVTELDAMAADGSPDQKRAVAVVRNLLSCWQRTQSAGVPDTSELQRVIYNADYNAKRMLDADSFWWSEIATIRVEFERFIRSLAAAPAQGQQVEWRTTAVMLEQANAGLAQLNGKLRAELSALKAQQVGQEPAGEVHLRKGGGISLLLVELAQPLPPGTKLYTAPQPAPSQDVAGLVEAAKKADDALSALVRNDQPLETLARKYGSDWSSAIDKVRTELVIQIAAHDKQSGEKKS